MGKLAQQQLPLKLRIGGKTDVRTQFAALCFRYRKKELQVCLVTTRRTGRWILPKGWPMHRQTPADAAATEAWEEAGLTGDAIDHCLGVYAYVKPLKRGPAPIITLVYPIHVRNVHAHWPEKQQRKRKWFSMAKAARKVAEPELKRILSTFDPQVLRRA